MKKTSLKALKQMLGILLIVIAVAMLLYDFFSPPVGQISNFALILFAKLTAIAGSLLNLNFKNLTKNETI